MELLRHRGAIMSYTDPFVARLGVGAQALESVSFDAAVSGCADCVVIATDHTSFDYARIAAMPLVVDTRNALRNFSAPTIFRL
jgi:UDP-N-acetyl-D-glucosamine dehydrogenase